MGEWGPTGGVEVEVMDAMVGLISGAEQVLILPLQVVSSSGGEVRD